jgi:hypothetical protein
MIEHVDLPTASLMIGSQVMATTKAEYTGPTAVVEAHRLPADTAYWGTNNRFPQDVIKDVQRVGVVSSVIDRKVRMLFSGRLTYGTVDYDNATGLEIMKPIREQEIDDFLGESNVDLYCREALSDWYTYANIFPEMQMGRGKDRVVGLGCQDASHVRLSTMTDKGEILKAYVGDWSAIGRGSQAFELTALDPYYRVPQQMLELRKLRYILPVRLLGNGQFYYGLSPWNSLRASGWLDVAMRVVELKKHLLEHLQHIRYHIEFSELYWPTKFKNWDKMTPDERLGTMKTEVQAFDTWTKGKGQGGTYMSMMLESQLTKEQRSLVKINEMKMNLPEGAYLQDAQEAEFIICRDMGLNPALHGISPSKSGSSAGSGSVDRVARTNHILDAKSDADMVLKPLAYISRINGWDKKYGKGQRLTWWFQNYYAATLDRTMQVGDMNKPQVD